MRKINTRKLKEPQEKRTLYTNKEKPTFSIMMAETPTGFSGHCVQLPGCMATGKDWPQFEKNAKEAIALHLKEIFEEIPIPEPKDYNVDFYIKVADALTKNDKAPTKAMIKQ